MNSVEAVSEMTNRLTSQINSLRDEEIQIRSHIRELNDELEFLNEWLSEVQDEKTILLHAKIACRAFIRNGGGLDMFVD